MSLSTIIACILCALLGAVISAIAVMRYNRDAQARRRHKNLSDAGIAISDVIANSDHLSTRDIGPCVDRTSDEYTVQNLSQDIDRAIDRALRNNPSEWQAPSIFRAALGSERLEEVMLSRKLIDMATQHGLAILKETSATVSTVLSGWRDNGYGHVLYMHRFDAIHPTHRHAAPIMVLIMSSGTIVLLREDVFKLRGLGSAFNRTAARMTLRTEIRLGDKREYGADTVELNLWTKAVGTLITTGEPSELNIPTTEWNIASDDTLVRHRSGLVKLRLLAP